MTVRYFEGNDQTIADWLDVRIATALLARPQGIAICLPGGSTPFPILAELAKRNLDWQRIAIWPGDDRCVSADHEASNIGRLSAILGSTGASLMPLAEGADPPRFALTWLGMGLDGHIASLFPSCDPRADDPAGVIRLTPDPLPSEAPFERLSLTIAALLNSDEVLFVIRGEQKHALFEAAARQENDLPVARLLAAATGPVTCFT